MRIVTETRKASISGVQRRLKIGYNRAARLVEAMEAAGLVGPLQPNGAREIFGAAAAGGVSAVSRRIAALLMRRDPIVAAPAPLCVGARVRSASPASEVEKYLAGLSSWSADFKQTIEDGQGHVLRGAAGKFYLARPGKFRWDYSEPSEQLILADGKQIWFYDKDLAQANVRSVDGDARQHAGDAAVGHGLGEQSIRHHGAARRAADCDWFQLVPKHPDTDFQLVRIGFDKDGELASMFLADKLNQITQLDFHAPGARIRSSRRICSVSRRRPGVDVIGRDSK